MLVSLLIAVLVIGLLVYLIQILPLPQPFGMVAVAIVILIAIFWLVGYLPEGRHPLL